MFLAGILFIGMGITYLTKSNFFGFEFVTFGFIALMFVRKDYKNYMGLTTIKNYWLVEHLQRMTGSFVAALIAFLVVNAKYFPEQIPSFVYWLLPTVIFVPLIVIWSRKYEVKMP